MNKPAYIDTSAFLRAFIPDNAGHAAARALLHDQIDDISLVSSELLWLEADRAARRIAAVNPAHQDLPNWSSRTMGLLQMVDLDRQVINAARAIPEVVKSLDAIHIATAEQLVGAIEFVITTDRTMTTVLNQRGIVQAVSPSQALVRL